MSGEATLPSEAAPLVTAGAGPSEGSLLRELVGGTGGYREEEIVDDSGSELSEFESSEVGMEVEEEWEGKGRGRPNFKHATAGAGQQQSMQEFFRHGGDDIFDTPGKSVMGGALAHSLAAAASSVQEVGTVETQNSAKSSGEGVGKLDVGADEWAEEVADEVEMGGTVDSERLRTASPTSARWQIPTPVLVTPTKGSKRMAMGTLRPSQLCRPVARPMPTGFAAASVLEQILAAIAGLERKMEEKVGALEARMIVGMGVLVAGKGEREVRMAARLITDAEEREKRLTAKLLATEGIEREMLEKASWDIKQWMDLAELMERRRVEIGEVRKAVEMLAVQQAAMSVQLLSARTAAAEPEAMEGVTTTRQEEDEDEVEEWSDMEGVEREGLFGSKHAPALGEPVPPMPPAPEMGGRKKEKGKAKVMQIAVPPAPAPGCTCTPRGSAWQQRWQAAADTAKVVKLEVAAPIQSILKCPETVEAEKKQEEKRKEEVAKKEQEKVAGAVEKAAAKAEVRKRWEAGRFNVEEEEVYGRAMRPISSLADDSHGLEEMAAGKRIAHMAGMWALESQWEEEWTRTLTIPPQPRHQRQQQVQPRVPQQQQQQSNWAQWAAAAAALSQLDYKRVGQNGKPEGEPSELEPIKGSIPRDERGIVFERTVGASQINPAVAASAATFVNIALSKVAPAHVRTEAFRISVQGRLSTTARFGASGAMLLRFKKEILEVARRADRVIINVVANEMWAELKILVPYDWYRHQNGLADLSEQIEAENPGVVVPPPSMKWMQSVSAIERYYQAGHLPTNAASVIFKVPGKVAAQKLLVEMWVAGNKFRALPYIPDKADTLYGMCGQWGHSEFRCQQAAAICTICAGTHRTEDHRCEVVTCGKVGKVCPHTEMKCPNCGGGHPAQDARCRAKCAVIEIARGRCVFMPGPESPTKMPRCLVHPVRLAVARSASPPARPTLTPTISRLALLNWVPGDVPVETSPDRTGDVMETTGMEPSGTAPPVAL